MRPTLLLMIVVALGAALARAGAVQASDPTIPVVDTLGAATPTTQFSLFGSGGGSILPTQFPGPRFDLAQRTVLTEIGGFVDTFRLPATVEIVPAAADGSPDGADVLASFVLSSDGNPLSYAYESVASNVSLEPGTHFALFGVQDDDFGILLNGASSPFEYRAGLTPAGFFDPTSGHASASPGEFMAVRILGRVPTADELLVSLAAKVAGLGPGTSLADKVMRAQSYLAANDVGHACSTLAAFVNEAKAQSGKTISTEQAAELITMANEIRAKLGC